jgi:chromosome segregation ATPase
MGKPSLSGPTLITREAAQLLEDMEGSSLEAKLRNMALEKDELMDEIKQLKLDLEEERMKNEHYERRSMSSDINTALNGTDLMDAQRETKKLIHEYKFKLKKTEQENNTLQSNVSRLETQLLRYKKEREEGEKLEDELKTEKRKILRELREAQARVEELETSNSHLTKRIDKLKNNRMAIINS